MEGRAIVVGGSIGGLFTAALLLKRGWDVEVYERSDTELAGLGTGIVTHQPLLDALAAIGADTSHVGVPIQERVAYDQAGNVTHTVDLPQIVTSWDHLLSLTRATIPGRRYHIGHRLDHFALTSGGIRAVFDNAYTAEADVIVGADGFRSAVRGQVFPTVQPKYAGYVAWRAVVADADLPQEIADTVVNHFSFCLPVDDGEMLGYPIAGADYDCRPGHRRYFLGWYRAADRVALADMLTDDTGRTHDLSIPPDRIRRQVVDQFRDAARLSLAPPFAAILDRAKTPFFTPVYDHASPSMTSERVALVGDAPFLARPHIGAGVTKAAADAVALANSLSAASSLEQGLSAYNAERYKPNMVAYERAKALGRYVTASYAHGVDEPDAAAWKRDHTIETLMRDTAVLNFY